MKKITESLWNDYLADECAMLDTEEEKDLSKRISETHEELAKTFTKEQNKAIDALIDLLCELDGILAKKAFTKGCELTANFLLELKLF